MVMDAGDVKFTVKLEDKSFNDKMRMMGKKTEVLSGQFRKMGKVMMGVGLAITAALGAAVLSFAKAGDEVHKMALRTDFATETLSELRHVAMLTGTDLGSIEKSTKKMSKSLLDAERGLETYAKAFRELGLDIEELTRMSPEEQFWAIANALAGVEDHFRKSALAQEIFGRAGTELLPMLASTTEQIAAMRQEAHDLGIVFTDESAQAAADFTDAMGTLKESMQGVGFAIAEDLAPILTEFINDKMIPAITNIMDWVKANDNLAKTLGIVAGVLVAGGALLLGLGMVSRAIVAINMALVIMHGLAGPAGWIKLAAGIAIAAGAIVGIQALMRTPTVPEIPSMQFGGIVPGPIGKPMPIIAHGGEQFAGVGRSVGVTHIHIGNFMGDETSLREFSRVVKEVIGQDIRRTSFAGINKAEYFSGSSAP